MKALTLTQPWATLMATGDKTIETRSWRTPYRGRLAIHAAKNVAPVGGERGLRNLVLTEPFAHALRRAQPGYTAEELAASLPRGEIVGVVTLIDCERTETTAAHLRALATYTSWAELAFGDYSPGRYAWLTEARAQIQPVECRGGRGLWDVPLEIVAELEHGWEAEADLAWMEADAREDRRLDDRLRRRP